MASFAGVPCPDFAVKTLVPEGEEFEETTLSVLRGDKAMVIDFWTTKCTRCPAALAKLNGEAELAENDDVVFLSCALSQGDENYEVAGDLVCDGSFDSLTHVFMDMEVKEAAKAAFGFSSVPFYVVVGKGGIVLGAGEPKAVDYRALIGATVTENDPAAGNAGAAVANAAPAAPGKAIAAPVPARAGGLTFDEDF